MTGSRTRSTVPLAVAEEKTEESAPEAKAEKRAKPAKRAEPAPPPLATLRAIFAQVCEAVAAGHAEGPGIVHEGVSPSAVMLRDPDGDVRARVIDLSRAPGSP